MNNPWVRSLATVCAATFIIWQPVATALGPERRIGALRVRVTTTGVPPIAAAQVTGRVAGVDFFVDGVVGNDGNDGSAAKPFKSIQRGVNVAASQNRLGTPVTLHLKPATYRGAVAFPAQKYTAAPIALISTTPGGAVIDGSNVYTKWTRSSGSIYAHQWAPFAPCVCPYDAPNCPPGIGIRREMVFVNGELLTQVSSRGAMRAGTYFVDDGARHLYVWTPTGASPDSLTTTVSTRGSLLSATTGVRDLTLKGLVVRGSSDCAAEGAAIDIENVPNVVLQDVSAVWNNDEGIFISGATGTFQLTRVHADNNGFIGMGIHNTKNLQAADVTTNGNNWRGNWVNFGAWFAAGVKFGGLHDATITRWIASNNPSTTGFWLDTDATRVTISNLVANRNSGEGIVLEAIQGPVTIDSPILCQDAQDPVNGGSAILAQAAQNITVNNPIVYLKNTVAGSLIGVSVGANDPAAVTDWETGVATSVTTRSWTWMHGATVVNGAGQGGEFIAETDTVKADFWGTLMTDYNIYWGLNTTNVWANGPNPPVDFTTYKKWLSADQETHSVWANAFGNDPAKTCTFVGVRGVWPR